MTAKKTTDVAPQTGAQSNEVQKHQASPSLRFTEYVMKELQQEVDNPAQMTSHQKKVIQNSFIKLDLILKQAEQKRLAKKEEYRDPLAFTWENVNMPKLAQDIAAISAVGLDPMQKNQVHLVPYKNDKIGKYDFEPIIGYRGAEIKAKKFGLNIPDDVVIELVYSSDTFKVFKKNLDNKVENYQFEINNPFERGDIIGGFYYYKFNDDPTQNRLVMLSLSNILKRKPDYASAEFWGGEKDEWKNGQRTGNKTVVEGWFDEMCYKTVFRAAYDNITIDSEKITKHIADAIQLENNYYYSNDEKTPLSEMKKEVKSSAGSGQTIKIRNIEEAEIVPDNVDKETGEVTDQNDDNPIF